MSECGALDYLAKAHQAHLRREAAKARGVYEPSGFTSLSSVVHRLLGHVLSHR